MNKQIATLTAISQTPVTSKHKKTEETYEYKVGDKIVKFHAHPTRAWNWVILPETTADRKIINAVIGAMCEAGFEQDAIKTLELK